MRMSGNQDQPPTRIAWSVVLIVFLTLALSLVALIFSASVLSGFINIGSDLTSAYFLLALGILGIAISGYVAVEARRRMVKMKTAVSPVMTTEQCVKCDYKKVREFQQGDYIFKEIGSCPKCKVNTLMITAIYKEVKEKEKDRYPV
jgi:hypothetical protein